MASTARRRSGISCDGSNGTLSPSWAIPSMKWQRARSAPDAMRRDTRVSSATSSLDHISTLPWAAHAVPSGQRPPAVSTDASARASVGKLWKTKIPAICNHQVASSKPAVGTRNIKGLQRCKPFCFGRVSTNCQPRQRIQHFGFLKVSRAEVGVDHGHLQAGVARWRFTAINPAGDSLRGTSLERACQANPGVARSEPRHTRCH